MGTFPIERTVMDEAAILASIFDNRTAKLDFFAIRERGIPALGILCEVLIGSTLSKGTGVEKALALN